MLMEARMTNPVFVLDGAMDAMQALARSGGSRRTRCPDAIWDAAAEHFDEPQLAGLVLDIAQINVWNRLNVATRQVVGEQSW